MREEAPPRKRGFVRTTARWVGAIAGSLTLLVGFAAATAGVVDLTYADTDAAAVLGVVIRLDRRQRARDGADVHLDEDVLEVRLRAARAAR